MMTDKETKAAVALAQCYEEKSTLSAQLDEVYDMISYQQDATLTESHPTQAMLTDLERWLQPIMTRLSTVHACGFRLDAIKKTVFYGAEAKDAPDTETDYVHSKQAELKKVIGFIQDNSFSQHGVPLIRAFHALIGLTTELAELIEAIVFPWRAIATGKTTSFQVDTTNIKEEIGDVMWYLALLCESFHVNMKDCALTNIAKLKVRYPSQTFLADEALNRNTNAERQSLEGSLQRAVTCDPTTATQEECERFSRVEFYYPPGEGKKVFYQPAAFEDKPEGWYHWTLAFDDYMGPFLTRIQAVDALSRYESGVRA